ncbi:hypothetical protein EQH57_0551 [Dictyocoela roeselum]|nr:hypothetical protein EQH57_0551 [Dictyocoela roeselum]
MPRYSITNFYNYDRKTVEKIINKIVKRIPDPDFSSNKMGGVGKIIQVDETMLNYKVKSHRGRAPENKTDALCIIEYENEIKRVFACVIENKLELTIVPILCSQVAANSIIWTDEHGAYANLKDLFEDHGTVIHKYQFINYDTGVNTQAVECFNNLIKREIKMRMGVKTSERSNLLKEICYYYNNKMNFMEKILNLIKLGFIKFNQFYFILKILFFISKFHVLFFFKNLINFLQGGEFWTSSHRGEILGKIRYLWW